MLDVKPTANERVYMVVDTDTGEPVTSYPSEAAAWDHAISGSIPKGHTPVVGPGGMFKARGTGRSAGWTSDPRQALTMPTAEAGGGDVTAATAAKVRFIQARLRNEPFDAFATEQPENPCTEVEAEVADYGPESGRALAHRDPSPEETPEQELPGQWSRSDFMGGDPDERSYAERESDSEAPAEPDGPTTPEDTQQAESGDPAAREWGFALASLSERERVRFDNMAHLAESADTEPARAYWTKTLANWLEERVPMI